MHMLIHSVHVTDSCTYQRGHDARTYSANSKTQGPYPCFTKRVTIKNGISFHALDLHHEFRVDGLSHRLDHQLERDNDLLRNSHPHLIHSQDNLGEDGRHKARAKGWDLLLPEPLLQTLLMKSPETVLLPPPKQILYYYREGGGHDPVLAHLHVGNDIGLRIQTSDEAFEERDDDLVVEGEFSDGMGVGVHDIQDLLPPLPALLGRVTTYYAVCIVSHEIDNRWRAAPRPEARHQEKTARVEGQKLRGGEDGVAHASIFFPSLSGNQRRI